MEHCMEEKLDMTTPPFGYFSQLRVHDTARPKPIGSAFEFLNGGVSVPRDLKQTVNDNFDLK